MLIKMLLYFLEKKKKLVTFIMVLKDKNLGQGIFGNSYCHTESSYSYKGSNSCIFCNLFKVKKSCYINNKIKANNFQQQIMMKSQFGFVIY